MNKRPIFTMADLQKSAVAGLNPHVFQPLYPEANDLQKKMKHGAIATMVDGIRFDSKKEARRWKELLLLLKAGEIGFLERQVPFELNEGGSHSMKYYADFTYVTKEGEKIVEDAKGFRDRTFKKKAKLMLKVHNIKILET